MPGSAKLCRCCQSPARYDSVRVGNVATAGYICVNDSCADSWKIFDAKVVML